MEKKILKNKTNLEILQVYEQNQIVNASGAIYLVHSGSVVVVDGNIQCASHHLPMRSLSQVDILICPQSTCNTSIENQN